MTRRLGARVVLAGVGLLLTSVSGWAANPVAKEQVWEGVLKIRAGVELRLVFHVKEGDNGALSATWDSPDQGATGLKVDTVTRDRSKLSFEMKAVGAKFEGKLSESGMETAGTFTQGAQSFPLTLSKSDKPTPAPKLVGGEQLWEGKLSVGAGLQLRFVLHVSKTETGEYVAKLDSPDEGFKGLKLDPITIDKSKLAFELKVSGEV